MPLPKAPPPVRRHHLPPPAPRRGAAHHIRRMVRSHEEEERPFEPARAPTWRGSSKDLVVNPGGFEADLGALVSEYYGKLNTELTEDELTAALVEAFQKKSTSRALAKADELLEGHGVEALGPEDMYLYINFGDTYSPTIMYSRDEDKVFVAMGGWGDVWSEEGAPALFDQGWDSWLRSDFTHKLEEEAISADPDHDTDDPVPGGAQEKALAFIEGEDDALKELFQRAMHRAQNVGGKYPEVVEKSDGITVTHLPLVVDEAVDMLREGWRPGTFEGHSTRRATHRPNAAEGANENLARPLSSTARVLLNIDGDPVTLDLRKGTTPVVAIEAFLARFARADEVTIRRVRPFGRYTHKMSWFKGGVLKEAPLGIELRLR